MAIRFKGTTVKESQWIINALNISDEAFKRELHNHSMKEQHLKKQGRWNQWLEEADETLRGMALKATERGVPLGGEISLVRMLVQESIEELDRA